VSDLELSFKVYREAMAGTLDELHERASDFQTEQQVAVGRFEMRLATIDEHLRNTDANITRLERRRGNGRGNG
jgi:hypothetical protein